MANAESQQVRPARISPRARIIGGALAVAIAATAWIGVGLVQERAQVEKSAGGRTVNRAAIVSQYTRESFRRVEMALGHTADEAMRAAASGRGAPAELRFSLEAFVARSGLISRMAIIDKEGNATIFTGQRSDWPASFTSADVFSRQRTGEAGKMVFGTPSRSSDGKTRLLPASMRLSAPDGSFAGIVIADIDTAHFNTAFGALGKEPGGFYTLFLRSGAIIARMPDDAAIVDRNWADSPMFREHLPGASRKTVRQVVVATGIESLYSYDSLTEYPVVTASGLSLTGVLEPWLERVKRDLLLLGCGLAVLALGTWMLLRTLRLERAAYAAQVDSEQRYRRLFDTATLPMFVHVEGILRMVNPASVHIFGVHRADELLGRSGLEFVHPDDRQIAAMRGRAAADRREPQAARLLRYVTADGRQLDVEVTSEPFEFEGDPAVLTTARDVTQEVLAQQRVTRANQLYAALSQVNQVVVRSRDYVSLCEQVCRIAVDVGGMGCALVRRFDAERNMLIPVVFHGPATGLIGRHDLPLEGTTGVSVEAVKGEGPCVVQDMATSPVTVHAPGAVEHGINSAAAFALRDGERLIGTLAVFGPGSGFFDDDLVALLQEIANSLAYANTKLAAEATLAASEQHYRELVESLPTGIVVAKDGHALSLNRAAVRMYGYDNPAEAMLRPILESVHPAFQAAALERMATVTREHKVVPRVESRHLRRDGAEFPTQVTAMPIQYKGDAAILYVIEDLTERHEAERALRERERDLQLAQSGGRIGSVIIDLERAEWELSPVGYEILGIVPGWRPLADFVAMLAPESRSESAARMRANVASGKRSGDEYEIVRPADGARAWIRVMTDTEFSADGRPLRRLGTLQDITIEKTARLALARSEERFKLAIAASNVAIWDWNVESGICYLSDEYMRMFGYEPGEAVGDLGFLMVLVHPDDRKRTLKSLFRQWNTGVAATDYEQRVVCKNGSIKRVHVKADIVERDADGRALRMVGTASDLTARKAYEERILRLSRLYGAISKTNDAVVRQPDFAALCDATCRIAVEEGGLVSAIVRQHDAATDTLIRVALHGPVGGLVGRAVVSADDPLGVGPETFRRGTPVIVHDLMNDPLTQPSHADAAAQGIGATASFPLTDKGRPFGTFTVFAPDRSVLDEQTIQLLGEIADTLTFARAKFSADSALAASERDLALAQDAGRIGSIIIESQSGLWTTSNTGSEILGLDESRFRAHRDFEALLAPDASEAGIHAWRSGLVSTSRADHTYSLLDAGSGARRWVRMVTNTEFSSAGQPVRRIGIVQDVTTQISADQRIERLTRMYAALSSTNEAIVRGNDWKTLCDQVCRIIVEQGGVVSAALRMPDAALERLEVMAGFGPRVGAIGERAIPLVDDGTSIAVPVFRNAQVAVVNDFATHPVASTWLADAAPLQVNAAVVLPLRSGNRVVGVLSVYASAPGHFDGELAHLMGDLADNLGFAHAKLANEHAVAESEERFRALTMMASDWYWETDREHRFTRMSQGLQSDDGSFDAKSVIGKTRWDFGPMVMDPEATRAHRAVLDRRAPFRDFEYRRPGADGKMTIRCISGDPVFDDEGLFKGYRGVGRNVTEQRLAEVELRASEERYRTLVDASPDAIRVVCDGRIVFINQACVRLWGAKSQDEIIGRDPLEFIRPEHHARANERLRRVIEEGAIAAPIETAYVRPDGSSVDVETITLPFNFNGQPAALSIMRDLTERNTSQRALTEAERRYRSLVEASQGGVLLLAGDVVAYANPGIGSMLGFGRQDDIAGTSLYSVVLLESHEVLRAQLRRLSAHANQTMPRLDLRMRRRDGETINVTATATSIDLDGQTMIQMELRDVTRERLAMAQFQALNDTLESRIAERTRELTKSNSDLEAANRDLESFSYSVAHDLRAPLRSMAGFASLLEIDVATGALDDLPAHTARITQNAARMNALIDGLLAVSRVTHGELKDEEVDFAKLVSETIRDSNPGAQVKIAVDPLPVLRGDTSALRQVWANLLSNALKYSAKREAPQVQVGVELRDTEYVFHVRDNGAGFDPAFSQRLFGVFQRLHSAQEFEGTGVGLAVVRRVIERHGGHVWAEGRPNLGATFYFTLPAARLVAHPA